MFTLSDISEPFLMFVIVGMTGLEPATTGPPDQHSKPTELHPVAFCECKSNKTIRNHQILICFFTFFGLLNLALLAITYKIRTFADGFILYKRKRRE